MTARRSMHAARKRRSAEAWNWQTPQGKPLCLEGGKVHMLATGKPPDYDHAVQLALGGADDDENIQPLDPLDHKIKTKADAGARGKIRRIRKGKKSSGHQWPSRKLQSRGFNKGERHGRSA